MNKDLGKSVDNEINNAYEEGVDDGVLDALNRMENVYDDACDILGDILEEDGATVSERAFADYLMDNFFNVTYDLVMDEFDIKPVCCGDDDCCSCCSEDKNVEDFYEKNLETLKYQKEECCEEDDRDCEGYVGYYDGTSVCVIKL